MRNETLTLNAYEHQFGVTTASTKPNTILETTLSPSVEAL